MPKISALQSEATLDGTEAVPIVQSGATERTTTQAIANLPNNSSSALTGIISPSQITSNQNDYSPTGMSTASVLRLSTDASRNITGFATGSTGRLVIVHNVGSFNIVLKDETTSTAANRFALTADLTLRPDSVAVLQYDATSSRWRAMSGGGEVGNTTTPYEYGATGVGADDTTAMIAAIATGKHIDLRGGLFGLSTGITLADAQHMFNGRLIKLGNIDLITLGTQSVLDRVTGHGAGATYTGRGIVVPSGETSQYIKSCIFNDFNGYSMEFAADGAGGSCIVESCNFARTTTTLEAIKLPALDSGTNGLRMFIDVKGSGAALYDLAGSHYTQIIGGNSTLITFSADTTGLLMVGHRTGTIDVRGSSHVIHSNSFGNTINVKSNAVGVCLGPNIHQGGSVVLDSGATGVFHPNDEALTDNSAGGVSITGRPTSLFTVNLNADTTPAAPPTNSTAHFVGADAVSSGACVDSYGQASALYMRRANGTGASPTQVLSGETIGLISFRGYQSGGAFGTGNRVSFQGYATEDWTATAQGASFRVYTTPAGGTSTVESLTCSPTTFTALGFLKSTNGFKRVSSQFDKTADTTLADVTGLSVTVEAGKTYQLEAVLHTASNVGGGVQFAIAGTATATAIIYEALVHNAAAVSAQTRATALAGAVGGVTAVTVAHAKIEGLITVNAAGTLTAQFAQNASNATASSVLVGSTFRVWEVA